MYQPRQRNTLLIYLTNTFYLAKLLQITEPKQVKNTYNSMPNLKYFIKKHNKNVLHTSMKLDQQT